MTDPTAGDGPDIIGPDAPALEPTLEGIAAGLTRLLVLSEPLARQVDWLCQNTATAFDALNKIGQMGPGALFGMMKGPK